MTTTTTKRLFNFAIGSGITSERILSLKERNFFIRKPGQFRIYDDVDWDHELLGTILDIFFYFQQNKIIWEEFILFICYNNNNNNNNNNGRFTRQLLHSLNGLHSFKKISFNCLGRGGGGCKLVPQNINGVENIFPGIHLNKNLESICIGYTTTKNTNNTNTTNGHLISQADFLALNNLLSTTKSLKVLELHNVINFNPKLLSKGFIENNTLEKIIIEFNTTTNNNNNNNIDERISVTIQSLIGHPTLKEICIITKEKEQFGNLSLQAIQDLLVSKSNNNNNSNNNKKWIKHWNIMHKKHNKII